MPITLKKKNLEQFYNYYVNNVSSTNIVPGVVDFFNNNYASGFTKDMNSTQFKLNSKYVLRTQSGINIKTNTNPHRNIYDSSIIKAYNKNMFNASNKYSDTVKVGNIDTSPIGKYAITEKSPSPLLRQYSKFNLRNDSPGALEPFILRGIQRAGKNKEPQRWGYGAGSTGGVIAERAAADILRFTKFALTRNGINFAANSAILNLYFQTRPYASGVEISLKPPFIEAKKPDMPDFRRTVDKGGFRNKKPNDFIPAIPGVGILNTGKTDAYINVNTIKQLFGYENQKRIDRIYSDEDLYKDTVRNSDIIPIGFNRLSGEKAVFRGTLSGITDSFTPEWETYQYIGRPDSVANYKGVSRTLSFTFEVYVHNPDELKPLMAKLDFLAKLTMPKMSALQRMSGPLMKLTIGELYKEELGYISSLTINHSTDVMWELGYSSDNTKRIRNALPRAATVNVTYEILHNSIPQDAPTFAAYTDTNFIIPDGEEIQLVSPRPLSGGTPTGLPGDVLGVPFI